MIRRKQLLRHRPEEGIYGDCHRTAIACLLDLEPEQVPHFLHDGCDGTEFGRREREFLRSHGLVPVEIPVGSPSVEECLRWVQCYAPDVLCLLGGTSRNNCNHTVIAGGGAIAWDPSQTDAGIIGPCDDGFYWVTFLVPAALTSQSAVAEVA